jgi:integrase
LITEAAIRKAIASAPAMAKSAELRDGGERGSGRLLLVIRPYPDRVTAEWYAVTFRGRRRRSAKIGSYPTVTLAAARKTFREVHAPVISAGGVPTGARTRAAPVPAMATIGALFDDYVQHLTGQGKVSAKTAKFHLDGAAAAIGRNKLASAVTAGDIAAHLGVIHARGSIVAARDCRAYLHAAFARALKAENDYTQQGAVKSWGLAFNPVAAIPVDTSAARVGKRHLSPAEWVLFWRWLEPREETAAAALRLVMIAGQRLVEILPLTRPQYADGDGTLEWTTTKNKRPHMIPLPRLAVTILDGLTANQHGLYFPSAQAPGDAIGYDATDKLRDLFLAEHPEVEHFTARDLRRTWKTLTGAAGIAKDVRDRLQNHARSDVSSRHYDRYEYLPEKRAAMATWSDYVDGLLLKTNPPD